MTEKLKIDPQAGQAHMVVDGHAITLCFSENYNPTLAAIVKETLIDAFLRQSGIGESDIKGVLMPTV